MKNVLLPLILLLGHAASAQSGFFLQPEVGAGWANAKAKYFVSYQYPYWITPSPSRSTNSIFSYNVGLLAGYGWKNWHVSTGVSFMKTGFKEKNVEIATGGWYGYFTDNIQESYYHVAVPVLIAYDFHLGNRFCISPAVGNGVSYNISSTEKITPSAQTLVPENSSNHTLSSAEFTNYYKRLSDLGIVRLQAAYKLNNHISITAGPEAQFMLTNFWNNKTVQNALHNHSYTFNAGIMWHFKNVKANTLPATTQQ